MASVLQLLPPFSVPLCRDTQCKISTYIYKFPTPSFSRPHNSGFQSDWSTETTLVMVTNDLHIVQFITPSMVSSNADRVAAFGPADHSPPLSIPLLGSQDTTFSKFSSYFTDCWFSVPCAGFSSSCELLQVHGSLLCHSYTHSPGGFI